MMSVKKAVFPVAGLGTRFRPVTSVVPKEMLPIVDKPLIDYAIEEAVDAGITDLIFVVSPDKDIIVKYLSDKENIEAIFEGKENEIFERLKFVPLNRTGGHFYRPFKGLLSCHS